jgi:hypothetical protein
MGAMMEDGRKEARWQGMAEIRHAPSCRNLPQKLPDLGVTDAAEFQEWSNNEICRLAGPEIGAYQTNITLHCLTRH